MSAIDREGTFRGRPTDTGVGSSSGGHPQFVIKLVATEYFDEEEKVWVDWTEVAENEITAYLILFGGDKNPTLTAKQIKLAFGWSGESTFQLGNTDYTDKIIQFRVEQNTYQGKTTLQVSWVDAADTVPGWLIRKATDKELREMDSIYAKGLSKLSGGKTVTPVKPATEKPTVPGKVTKKDAPSAAEPATEVTKETNKIKTKKSCTKEEAWETVNAAKHSGVSDEKLEEIWLQTIEDLGDEASFKKEDWYRVREIVKAKVIDDIPF